MSITVSNIQLTYSALERRIILTSLASMRILTCDLYSDPLKAAASLVKRRWLKPEDSEEFSEEFEAFSLRCPITVAQLIELLSSTIKRDDATNESNHVLGDVGHLH